MKDLSRRQQAILTFIERFLDDNDRPIKTLTATLTAR